MLSGEGERVERLAGQTLRLRATNRGKWCDPFAARRVGTVYEGAAVEEWLVRRGESEGETS